MREEYDTADVVRWRLKCEAQEWATDHRRSNDGRRNPSASISTSTSFPFGSSLHSSSSLLRISKFFMAGAFLKICQDPPQSDVGIGGAQGSQSFRTPASQPSRLLTDSNAKGHHRKGIRG